jgi:hypothetical protein
LFRKGDREHHLMCRNLQALERAMQRVLNKADLPPGLEGARVVSKGIGAGRTTRLLGIGDESLTAELEALVERFEGSGGILTGLEVHHRSAPGGQRVAVELRGFMRGEDEDE